jgi:Ser/Thr protein kinase RdoA (MazF antagonist)
MRLTAEGARPIGSRATRWVIQPEAVAGDVAAPHPLTPWHEYELITLGLNDTYLVRGRAARYIAHVGAGRRSDDAIAYKLKLLAHQTARDLSVAPAIPPAADRELVRGVRAPRGTRAVAVVPDLPGDSLGWGHERHGHVTGRRLGCLRAGVGSACNCHREPVRVGHVADSRLAALRPFFEWRQADATVGHGASRVCGAPERQAVDAGLPRRPAGRVSPMRSGRSGMTVVPIPTTLAVGCSIASGASLVAEIRRSRALEDVHRCQLLPRGLNAGYLVAGTHDCYIARVYGAPWRPAEWVAYELELLRHVAAEGVSVSEPVRTRQGYVMRPLAAPEGTRQLVLFTFDEGAPLFWDDQDYCGSGPLSRRPQCKEPRLRRPTDHLRLRSPRPGLAGQRPYGRLVRGDHAGANSSVGDISARLPRGSASHVRGPGRGPDVPGTPQVVDPLGSRRSAQGARLLGAGRRASRRGVALHRGLGGRAGWTSAGDGDVIRFVTPSVPSAEALLEEVRRAYGIAVVECELLRAETNDAYLLLGGGAVHLVRTYGSECMSRAQIAYEPALLRHPAARGVSVGLPLARADDQLASTVAAPEGVQWMVVFTHVELPAPSGRDRGHCRLVGASAATVDTATDSLTTRYGRTPLDLTELTHVPLQKLGPFLSHRPNDWITLRTRTHHVKARVEVAIDDGLDWRACHTDLNVRTLSAAEGGRAFAFNLDLCGPGWRAFDLPAVHWVATARGPLARSAPRWGIAALSNAYLGDKFAALRRLVATSPVQLGGRR